MKKNYIKYFMFLFISFFTFMITSFAGNKFSFELQNSTDVIDLANEYGWNELDGFNLLEFNVSGEGDEYVKVIGCTAGSSTACKISSNTTDFSHSYYSTISLRYSYVNASGETVESSSTIGITIGRGYIARLLMIGGTKVDYSGWSASSGTLSNGRTYEFYVADSASTTLPTPSNSVLSGKSYENLVEFKGYEVYDGASAANGNIIIHSVGTCNVAAKPGDAVQDGKVYSACYEYKNYLQISTDGYGALASSDGTKLNKTDDYFVDGSTKWYFDNSGNYFTSSNDSSTKAKLPYLNFDGAFNAGRKLECWVKQGTTDCVVAGSEVALDGSIYVARVVNEKTSYNTYRSVRVGQTSTLTISDGTVSSCALENPSNTKISVEFSDGKCKVTGKTVTDYNEYIAVIVKYDSDSSERTFFFSVDNNVTSFTVADEATKLTENLYVDESGFQSNVCSEYTISAGGKSEPWGSYNGSNLTSTIYNVTTKCSNDANQYVAFCLDPGRAGPSAAGLDYYLTAMLDKDSELGKLAYYISNRTDITLSSIMTEVNNTDRVSIHLAFRIVAIGSGYGASADPSDELYAVHYAAYQAMASEYYKDNNYESNVNTALNQVDWAASEFGSEVRSKLTKILSEFHDVDIVNVDDFKRVITSTNTETTESGGYTITYKGKITAPVEAGKLTLSKPAAIGGIEFDIVSFDSDGVVSSDNEKIKEYSYEVKVIVGNASSVTSVPTTRESQIPYSFKVTYEKGTGVGNIFIASPASAGAYQRMTVFNLNQTDLYLYFDIAPSTCDNIPALDYESHCGANSCDSNFNEDLFKLSGCCKYVTDEDAYPYIIHSVCNSSCTTSTMSSVCSYNASNVGKAELYEIREGSKYTGTEYIDSIGGDETACVVNVTEYTGGDSSKFNIKDSSDNEIYSKAFSTNQYCKVTCKEDWQISMSSFGNYVGVNAVAAGSYFQIQNKEESNNIFIGQTVTCYTSYINVNRFMQEVVDLSNKIVTAYNDYSNYSHIYSDMDKWTAFGTDEDEITVGNTDDATAYKGTATGNYVQACKEYYQQYICSSGTLIGTSTSDCFTKDGNKYCKSAPNCVSTKNYETGYSCYSVNVEYNVESIKRGSKCYIKKSDYSNLTLAQRMKWTRDTDISGYGYSISAKSYSTCPSGYSDTGTNCKKTESATPVDNYACKTYVYAHAVSVSVGMDSNHAYGKYNDDDKGGTSADDGKYATIGSSTISSAGISSGSGPNGTGNTKANRGSVSEESYSYTDFELNNKICTVTTSTNGTPDTFTGNCYVKDSIAETLDSWAEKTNDLDAKITGKAIFEEFVKNGDTKGTYLKQLDEDTKAKAASLINLNNQVVTKIDDMYACQHFILYNASTTEAVASVKINGTYSEYGSKSYTMIESLFNPGASYNYDEAAFNSILQSNNDNYIEQFTELNDKYYGGEGKYNSSNNTSVKLDGIQSTTGGESVVNLSRNDLKSTYYLETSSWNIGSDEAKNYEGSGKNVVDWTGDTTITDGLDYESSTIVLCGGLGTKEKSTDKENVSKYAKAGNWSTFTSYTNTIDGQWYGGACFEVNLKYLDISYLETSISNSSFYKNKGYWYVGADDNKEHGDDFATALKNAKNRNVVYNVDKEKKSGRWSKLGMYNVFPVSITTPRNLYTYTYTFFDIGTYFNADAAYGRIMGASSALIANNSRTCFYEVYEEVCLCCGDSVINTVIGSSDSNSILEDFLGAAGNSKRGDYSYTLSDKDKMDSNSNASLGFMSSSVSLSDLTAGTGNSASNWSDSSEFLYAESSMITNKGEVASNSIQGIGETIYSSTDNAEYSYVLTPATLSTIRNYNDAHGYEINYDNLTVYGRYSIASLTSDPKKTESWETTSNDDMNEIINFQHYGSKFLEEFMYNDVSNAVVKSLAKSGNGNICYLVESDSSDRSDEIKSLMDSGCRWIDYIEDIGNNSSGSTEYKYVFAAGDVYPDTTRYFRLAFK